MRKGKAIRLEQGYRRLRWRRPPRPRAKPHRRSKRQVKKHVWAAMQKREQVQACSAQEADVVICVLQESLRKAILTAEVTAKLAAQPRCSQPKQEQRCSWDQLNSYFVRVATAWLGQCQMLDQAKKRANEAEARLQRVTAKLSHTKARARANKERADDAEDELERVRLQPGRAKVKLAERKQQQGPPQAQQQLPQQLRNPYATPNPAPMAAEACSSAVWIKKFAMFAMFLIFSYFLWHNPFRASLLVMVVIAYLALDCWLL